MRFVTSSAGYAAFVALAAFTVVLPVAESGCGRTACFVYSKGEYDHQSSCPTQAAALTNFTDPSCPGPVVTVDGAGVFSLNSASPDQSLCCYPVTQQDLEQTFSDTCMPPTGGGGAGGFNTATGGFSMTTSFEAVGVGTGGGTSNCFSCNLELMDLGANPMALCPLAADSWNALEKCICGGSGPCATLCKLNLCVSATMSPDCFNCIDNPATSGCGEELTTCEGN